MILQELNRYYERKISENDTVMPPYGTSVESISFALIIDKEGQLQGVDDLREESGKKLIPRKISVPAAVTRTSGIKSNYLWDKSSYVLGADGEGAHNQNKQRFAAFRQHLSLVSGVVDDIGITAIANFLGLWDCDLTADTIARYIPWETVAGANLVFRLEGERGYIHERVPAQKAWMSYLASTEGVSRIRCLITGQENQPLAKVHTPIKGVQGGQMAGGYIVSFNAPAFVSYQRDKADIGEGTAFAYTTALNFLLRRGSRQKVVIGDTTIVFWAECRNVAEELFADLFAPNERKRKSAETGDDQQTAGQIFDLLNNIRTGKRAVDIVPDLDESVRFFILGLAPNSARLSIRFWMVSTVGNLLENIGKHFSQLEIVRQFDGEPEFPPLWRLLCQTATLGKSENVLPVLAGGLTKAMLNGGLYPQSLLAAVLGRIRAEREVGYFRAGLLKAFLVRNKQMEISMYYDPNRKEAPYLLGGLFAVLEKAQADAIPGATATMKDRFFASAPATPARVFPMLLKNAANHIAKLRKDPARTGWGINLEKSIQDSVAHLANFPQTMSLEEQGLFMIGYYQRMKDFYTSKNTTANTTEEN